MSSNFRGLTDPRLTGALRRAEGGKARKKKKGILSIVIVMPPHQPGPLEMEAARARALKRP
jgi:hypothetical protein